MSIANDCAKIINETLSSTSKFKGVELALYMQDVLHKKYPTAGFMQQGKLLEKELAGSYSGNQPKDCPQEKKPLTNKPIIVIPEEKAEAFDWGKAAAGDNQDGGF